MRITAWSKKTSDSNFNGYLWILPSPYINFYRTGRGQRLMLGCMWLRYDIAIGTTWILTGKKQLDADDF